MNTLPPSFSVAGFTHPGYLRTINEDAMTWNVDVGFIGLADGMGGHNAGEIASKLALEALSAFLIKSGENDEFTWPYGVNPKLSLTANRLTTAIKVANRRVFRASEERSEYTGMGTTLAVAMFEQNVITFSAIGDSRIYVFDGDRLRQITRDDSWISMLSRDGRVDVATLAAHPMRNVLTNVIGAQPEVQFEVDQLTLNGSTLLFCSDGLHSLVSDDQIAEVLRSNGSMEQVGSSLIDSALRHGGNDNVTVVLAKSA